MLIHTLAVVRAAAMGADVTASTALLYVLPRTVMLSATGAVAGAVFALMLMALERRSSIATLRPSRVGLWGAGSGAAFALLVAGGVILHGGAVGQQVMIVIAVTAAFGAASATGSLLLARTRPNPRRSLPSAPERRGR